MELSLPSPVSTNGTWLMTQAAPNLAAHYSTPTHYS